MAAALIYFKRPLFIASMLFLLAIGLRIFHIDQMYVFGADEEYQANIAMSLVRDLHPIWIGVSAANTGFYLGPFWSYVTYIWLLVSNGDPLITAYVAAFLGGITVLAVFYTGWKVFSLRVGIVAGLLYSCLPLIVFFDQKYWNPSVIPLLSVAMIYSLFKAKENQIHWLLFAFAYALVFHTHLSLSPFILLTLYSARNIRKTFLLGAVIIFLVTVSPLIVFDYFHNWSNISTPLRFGEIASSVHPSLLEKVRALGESALRLWYLPPYSINANEVLAACFKHRSLPSLLSIPFLPLIFIFFFKKQIWLKENTRILALGILLISFSYILFPGRSDEYYLLGLFPLLLFIPGIIWNKYFSPILICLFCIMGIITVISSFNPYGLGVKKQIITQVMSVVGDSPYELIEKGGCHQYEGWRYLFATYARPPERSSIDSVFGWLYPEEIHDTPVKYTVIITGNDTANLGFTYEMIPR